jgi:hypothetical protein
VSRKVATASSGTTAKWTQETIDLNAHVFSAVVMSVDGSTIFVADKSQNGGPGGYIWRSTTRGQWTALTAAGSRAWSSLSFAGTTLIAGYAGAGAAGTAGVFMSYDNGATFSPASISYDPTSGFEGGVAVRSSANGNFAVADLAFNETFLSTNNASTFPKIASPGGQVSVIAMPRIAGLQLGAAWGGAPSAAIVNHSGAYTLKTFDPGSGSVLWSGGPAGLTGLNRASGLAIDSSGCPIVLTMPGSSGFTLQKISADGTQILWAASNTTDTFGAAYLGIDHADNCYVVTSGNHHYTNDGQTLPLANIYKVTSGSIVGTVTCVPFGSPIPDGGQGDASYEVDTFCVTSSGVAVCGGSQSGRYPYPPHGSTGAMSTGSFGATWDTGFQQFYDANVGGGTSGAGLSAADASSNVYQSYEQFESVGPTQSWLVKINSASGAISSIAGYAAGFISGVVDVDSSGNVYQTVTNQNVSPNTYVFEKISSAGAVAWSRSLGTSSGGLSFGLAFDDGFVYVDQTNGAQKIKGSDGTTVVWTSTALALASDNVTYWARPQY